VLRAGLTHAAWVTVDDMGARHKSESGFCTQICNDHFTFFATTGSKSDLNFPDLLRPDTTITWSTKKPSPICATARSLPSGHR
jgi:hypothetical protein